MYFLFYLLGLKLLEIKGGLWERGIKFSPLPLPPEREKSKTYGYLGIHTSNNN